ncbi:response regulator transcription factor [Aestuariibius sp. 2305UL40-4]|uniref:response regulator transcription factor n=1 Tax=Aestuariibius violaceus TaxID=3234132 RepID=UPI00345F00AC
MRVLLLEDNPKSADMFGSHLRRIGFAVDLVTTLDEAGDAVETAAYDLLLLDRQVPDGDSKVWLSARRRGGMATPALFMTVRDKIEDRIEGLDAGADDYLPKPVSPDELEARIRAILRRPAALLPTKLVTGNVAFDPVHRETAVAEQPIQLSRREGCMLEHLMRRTGRVVQKQSLEESLYGHGEEVTPNSIEVCICRLRKSLISAGATAEIHTVRGVGYLIRERKLN